MKKLYISPNTKIKVFSLERRGILVDETFPVGSGGSGIEDGGDIQSLDPIDPQNPDFHVWDDKDI